MKTTLLPRTALSLIALFVSSNVIAQAQLPFKPLADAPANAEEQQQLSSLFAQARAASAGVAPGPNATAQRRAVANELNNELENFVASHPNSAWTPAVRLWLARNAQLRSTYGQAMNHYRQVWETTGGLTNSVAVQMGREAGSGLAMLLALTGRLAEFDALEAQARQLGAGLGGSEAGLAKELRAWARKHPTEAYKCGLYCLDQLGRLTQLGQFRAKDVVEAVVAVAAVEEEEAAAAAILVCDPRRQAEQESRTEQPVAARPGVAVVTGAAVAKVVTVVAMAAVVVEEEAVVVAGMTLWASTL